MSIEKFVREKVSENLEKKQKLERRVSFDPTIILTIVQVITTLIQSCDLFKGPPSDIQQKVKKVELFERWSLRLQVKSAIDDNRIFKLYGAQIVEALVQTAGEVSIEDITQAIDEVRGT